MTHPIFLNVIKIGCTTGDIEEYAKLLSAKSPGHYKLYFSLPCDNPGQIKKQIRKHFNNRLHNKLLLDVSRK